MNFTAFEHLHACENVKSHCFVEWAILRDVLGTSPPPSTTRYCGVWCRLISSDSITDR